MTQASFLAIGTMGNRTSPVIRGSLVKEILLNDPLSRPMSLSHCILCGTLTQR